MNNVSGHGAAVARAVRDREVAGSNPVIPTRKTRKPCKIKGLRVLTLPQNLTISNVFPVVNP